MMGGGTHEDWVAQYARSHQHPVNRFLHTFGIPMIVISLATLIASIFIDGLWIYGVGLFIFGWILQFVGHAYEGKPPEFLQDWRFLLVGTCWWWEKIQGKV